MNNTQRAQKEVLDQRLRFLITSMQQRIAGEYCPEQTLKLYKESLQSLEKELDKIKQISYSQVEI